MKDFRTWIFKSRENGETVIVGNSDREGIMNVYTLNGKQGIINRRESTWAEIDSWNMVYITTVRRLERPSVEFFRLFK